MSENKIQNLDLSVLDQIVGGATTIPSALTPYMRHNSDKNMDYFRVRTYSGHTSGSLPGTVYSSKELKGEESILAEKFQTYLKRLPHDTQVTFLGPNNTQKTMAVKDVLALYK